MAMANLDAGATAARRRKMMVAGTVLLVVSVLGATALTLKRANDAAKRDIMRVLENRADGLNQKDLARYLACFAPGYRSETQTYQDLQQSAAQWFEQFVTIRFSFQVVTMRVQGRDAVVENRYTFALTGQDGETLTLAQRELLNLTRAEQGWQIVSARAFRAER